MIWILVAVQVSSWDGDVTTKRLGAYQTQQECLVAKKEFPPLLRGNTFICAQEPQK